MRDPLLSTMMHRFRLWRTPRTAVRDLADGAVVKVIGRARSIGEPVLGPFTGRALVTLRAMGMRVHNTGRSRRYEVFDDVEKGQQFLVEDETGVARVELAGFSRLFAPTLRAGRGAADHVERYFARYGQHERTFFDGFAGDVYYWERGVEEGAEVAVLGLARATGELAPASARGGYREAPRLFVIEPPASDRVLVSEEPGHRRR